ncbi:ATP-binding protein [Streptomyces sp. NPDC049597]|uniref:ATP-binding protein n=1 Tax=Streptomyces sp. NPDC049597 TaxID=3155276 RepID=UPI00341FEDCB
MPILSSGESTITRSACTWILPASVESPGEARRQATDRLQEWQHSELSDNAALIISELVTNAVHHGAGPAWLTLRMVHDEAAGCVLRIEVGDHGPGWDGGLPSRATPSDEDCNGRGLCLVEAVSSRWGTYRLPHGQLVWAELVAREQHDCRTDRLEEQVEGLVPGQVAA